MLIFFFHCIFVHIFRMLKYDLIDKTNFFFTKDGLIMNLKKNKKQEILIYKSNVELRIEFH